MDARRLVSRGISTGLRLGRGGADRVVTVAGPPVGRLARRTIERLRRRPAPRPETFTPSRPEPDSAPPAAAPRATGPSPASVARNIGPQRPTARPVPSAKPRSTPGAKLPPPRPSTS